MKLLALFVFMLSLSAHAQEFLEEEDVVEEYIPAESYEAERGPASVAPISIQRPYPGGADEEDLRVQSSLPEAKLKVDARSVQREVFKQLYNQELKDERHDTVEE